MKQKAARMRISSFKCEFVVLGFIKMAGSRQVGPCQLHLVSEQWFTFFGVLLTSDRRMEWETHIWISVPVYCGEEEDVPKKQISLFTGLSTFLPSTLVMKSG